MLRIVEYGGPARLLELRIEGVPGEEALAPGYPDGMEPSVERAIKITGGAVTSKIGRCARCTDEIGCEPTDDPSPGDVCSAGCGGARPEEVRCTKDGQAQMYCSGCLNVWTAQPCKDDESCDAIGMGPGCVKRRR